MGSYSRTYNFTNGTVAYGDQLVVELDALGSSVNNIVNAQISSGAAIADSKLATISSAGKVSGAALTLLANIPSAAGEIPVANMPDDAIIQNEYIETVALVEITTTTPADDSKPTSSEGGLVLTAPDVTPISATDIIDIEAVVYVGQASAFANVFTAAVFDGTTCKGMARVPVDSAWNYGPQVIHLHTQYAGGDTSAHTITLRVGADAAGTVDINGVSGARIGGGACVTSLNVKIIKQ